MGKQKNKSQVDFCNQLGSRILAPLVGHEPTTYRLTAERSTNWANGEYLNSGDNLFSQQGNPQISSAHWSLTSVFGMGTGIASMLLSPEKLGTSLLMHIIYHF